jgi:prepilin-type N-terminal cleavage/methylation domain-containing protein
MFNFKKAFTLAEVLITLGIIGIVAALTMPALVANYQKKVTATQLKEFYSIFAQATRLSVVDNGDVAEWDYPSSGWNGPAANAWFEKYYMPYVKLAKYCGNAVNQGCGSQYDSSSQVIKMILPNSVSVAMTGSGNRAPVWWVDVNGNKGPNEAGRDIFMFEQMKGKMGGSSLTPYLWNGSYTACDENTRECLMERCELNAMNCAGIIRYDNWEIKDDYPHL